MDKIINTVKSLITDTLVYKCCLIVMAFLYVFPFTTEATQIVMKWILVWGGVILACDLIKKRVCFQTKDYILFYLFLLFTGISSLINYENQLIRNVVDLMYIAVTAGIPLIVDKKKDLNRIIRELKIITMVVTVITTGVALASFLIYLTGFQGSITANGAEYLLGTVEGRLYGVMGNPNSSAHMAFISIVFSVLGIKLYRGRKIRIFHCANLLLQFIILSLGNSRSALVCLSVAVSLYLFFLIRRQRDKSKTQMFSVILSIILAFVIGSGCTYVGAQMSNKLVASFPAIYNVVSHMALSPDMNKSNNDVMESELSESTESFSTSPSKQELILTDTERHYATSDISNGRLPIWFAGLSVAKDHIFFGVGSENIQEEVNLLLPKDVVEKTPGIAANMHNIYLQILVGSGILALFCFIGFFALMLIKVLRYLYRSNCGSGTVVCIVSILLCGIVGMLVENIFDSNLIGFMCLFIVPVFWIMCGYLIWFINQIEKKTGGNSDCKENFISD